LGLYDNVFVLHGLRGESFRGHLLDLVRRLVRIFLNQEVCHHVIIFFVVNFIIILIVVLLFLFVVLILLDGVCLDRQGHWLGFLPWILSLSLHFGPLLLYKSLVL